MDMLYVRIMYVYIYIYIQRHLQGNSVTCKNTTA